MGALPTYSKPRVKSADVRTFLVYSYTTFTEIRYYMYEILVKKSFIRISQPMIVLSNKNKIYYFIFI